VRGAGDTRAKRSARTDLRPGRTSSRACGHATVEADSRPAVSEIRAPNVRHSEFMASHDRDLARLRGHRICSRSRREGVRVMTESRDMEAPVTRRELLDTLDIW